MHAVIGNNLLFVKEQVGMFKAANNYDIYEPSIHQKITGCGESNLGFLPKFSDLLFTNV